MDLLHLKYFQVVARIEHITKASQMLNVAQPALSKTISSLEKELGVKLFDRKGRYIFLNGSGKLFLQRVDTILSLLESSKKEIQDLSFDILGEVKIIAPAASNMLPKVLSEFKKEYPSIKFRVASMLYSPYSKRDFDLCISSTTTPIHSPETICLLVEEIFLGVSINHPLAKKNGVYLREIENENIILINKGENFREVIDILCKTANFNIIPSFECDSPYTVYSLIKSMQGVGFICGKTSSLSNDPEIKLISIKDINFSRYLNLSWFNEEYTSKATALFKEFIIDYFSKLE